MSFVMDYDQASEGSVQPGEYEVILKDWEYKQTKQGTNFISFALVIRNDIEQKHKNHYVWSSCWAKKGTTEYAMWVLATMGKAMKIKNGKEYSSLDGLLDDFKGKICKIKLIKRGEYTEVSDWMESEFPTNNHAWKDKDDNSDIGREVQISDDDLPF